MRSTRAFLSNCYHVHYFSDIPELVIRSCSAVLEECRTDTDQDVTVTRCYCNDRDGCNDEAFCDEGQDNGGNAAGTTAASIGTVALAAIIAGIAIAP